YKDIHEPDVRLFLHYGDLADSSVLKRIIEEVEPDEIYNLGAQSHVQVSFYEPEYTADIDALGTLRMLEAFREYVYRTGKNVKFYQASSSEMFGASPPMQNENTPFRPLSPYAVSKVFAFYMAQNYRQAYKLFVVNGILFNHESPRRGETFVTRKITRAATRIKLGLQKKLYLGNLNAIRDWGFAGDYVKAMWMMLQADKPDDYVVATGVGKSVKDFLEDVFNRLGLNWRDFVEIDKKYIRPLDVEALIGDASKIRNTLGWKPEVDYDTLVDMMVEHDLKLAEQEKILLEQGHRTKIF
ncbi:MAG: GDP-mannose 4,6-dehydratase, partial [bacterium]|nr:GDP-mannose 4,6-dehydratase [bacterium]